MKTKTPLLILCALLMSCANMTPQQQAIATTATNLATITASTLASIYGGPQAGQLASTLLSGVGTVVQAYVGYKIPTSVVQASPGVQAVGAQLATLIAPNHVVTQADANKVFQAAQIASALKTAVVLPSSP